MDQQVDLTFSSPISQTQLDGFNENRQRLIDLVMRTEATDSEGITSSNYEGWHSKRDVHLDDSEDTQWLVRRLSLIAANVIRQLTGQSKGVEVMLKECWFNIHRAGAWNMPHKHPAWWSGVLYISGDFDAEGGDIMFFNPVPQSTQSGYPDHKIFKPEPGLVLMFPGYLSHMVTPYKGDEPRISIAFNIDPAVRPDSGID